ncbi:DUF4232 domain-containing protein [Streptomyces sp. NPDC092296]|uniref:DUF4232 domain-containing protein n=1 Tax=Streptomyces sp. NPDC092296 TaxID=3366012 RepID=UPI0037F1ED2D
MRLTRITVATAAVLIAGLGLTACNSDGDSSPRAGGSGSSQSATTGSADSSSPDTGSPDTGSPDSGGADQGGGTGDTSGGSSTSGGSGTTSPGKAATPDQAPGTSAPAAAPAGSSRCRTEDLTVTVQGPGNDASEQQAAVADIQVVNSSGRTCTLKGFPGVELTDDQGKSDPLTARRQDMTADTVRLAPGAKAVADLAFSNINREGTASARKVCGVQASYASVILPDERTTVKVKVQGGVDHGVLNVCGRELALRPFETR